MFRIGLSVSLALCMVAVAMQNSARAEVIGVGIDWRSGIFVQEYWEKGAPHYLLANLTTETAEITVHDFARMAAVGKAVAGPWKVPAGGQALVDAKPLLGGGLRQFMLSGKQSLGLLPSSTPLAYEGPGYATSQGLNGSGGSGPGVFLVQPKLEFAGGSTVKIVLHVPSNSGTIKLKRQSEASNDPLRPSSLAVESAVCDTLPITQEEKQFVIDSISLKAEVKSHEVVLSVALPKATSPQLQMLDGWLARRDGGGNGITRGVWIVVP